MITKTQAHQQLMKWNQHYRNKPEILLKIKHNNIVVSNRNKKAQAYDQGNQAQDSLDILYLLLSEGSSKFLLAIVHSCGLFFINIGEGTASLRVAVLPSVIEYLYDELDGVSDLMSSVQPLLTQAVTDDDHSKRNSKKNSTTGADASGEISASWHT